MPRKGLLALALASVLMVGAYSFYAAHQAPQELTSQGLLLPALNVAEISALRIEHAGQQVHLQRTEQGWVLPDKASYPAAAQPVARLLLSLKEAQKREARTANPEHYGRLGLAETGSAEQMAKRLSLEGVGVELLLGKASSQEGQLMRLAGHAQSWLVSPAIAAPIELNAWLDRRISDIAFAEIKRVTVTLKDGERLTVMREKNQPNMQVEGLDPTSTLAYETAANGMATLFSNWRFMDVEKAAGLALDPPLLTVDLTTFDLGGLKADVHQKGEQYWLVVAQVDGDLKAKVAATKGWAYLLESRHYQALAHNLKAVLKP